MKTALVGAMLLASSTAYAQCTCGGDYVYRSWEEPQYVELNPYEWRYQIPDSYDSYSYSYQPRWHWRWVYDQVSKKPKAATDFEQHKPPASLKLTKTVDQVDKCNLREYFRQEKEHGKDQAQKTMREYCK